MDTHLNTEIITSLFGIALLVGGIINISKRIRMLKNGIKVEGVVLRIEKKRQGFDAFNFLYYPVVKYLTVEKKWITQEYNTGSSLKFYNEGDKVVVFYDKIENNKFIIDNLLTRWTGPLVIFLSLCVLCIVILFRLHNS